MPESAGSHSSNAARWGGFCIGTLCLGALVPVFFLRSAQSVFVVPQAVAALLVCLAATGCWLASAISAGRGWRTPTLLRWTTLGFGTALVLSTLVSPSPWSAGTGLHARGAGMVTYLGFLALLHSGSRVLRGRSCRPVLLSMLVAQGVVAGYGLLQASGNDPLDWAAQISFGVDALSTLGNPNFSSALVAIVVPITLRFILGGDVGTAIRIGATILLAVAMAGIAHMSSFQGNVVAVTSLGVLVCWIWSQEPDRRLEATLLGGPLAVVVLLYPLIAPRPGVTSVLGVGCLLASLTLVIVRREGVWRAGGSDLLTAAGGWLAGRSRRWQLLSFSAMSAGGMLVSASYVLQELRDGLSTRRGFFEVGLEVFSAQPIVGTGLETFESYYTALRPISDAVTGEVTRTDSIHSVLLGMFTGGGLVLGVSYLALVGVIGCFGIRAVRLAEGTARLEVMALLSAWSGFHLQSAISVDIPALGILQWLLGGMLVARGAGDLFEERQTSWRFPGWVAPVAVTVMMLVVAVPVSAPLLADLAAHRARVALDAGDVAGAVDHMARAVELQPRDGRHAEAYGHTLRSSGRPELALEQYRRDQEARPGRPGSSMNIAVAAAQLNLLGDAAMALEQAMADDPHASALIAEAALFYASIGRTGRAGELLDRHAQLGSHLGADVIAQARWHLGEG